MKTREWLAEAQSRPLAFAQVREDPLLDQMVVEMLPPASSLMMVASGGCTAAWLARHPRLREITLVDSNPVQLTLTRLKLHLLVHHEPATRMKLLGHATMDSDERCGQLAACLEKLGMERDSLGLLDEVALHGPDYWGRYERLFRALQDAIAAEPELASALRDLLQAGSVDGQINWLARNYASWQRLEGIFADVFTHANLTALFGAAATQNRQQDFSAHFCSRLLDVLLQKPVRENPYIWQLLFGHYPERAMAPWLSVPRAGLSASVEFIEDSMLNALLKAAAEGRQYQMLHLSNVLDWLSADQALATLMAAWRCSAPGGWIVVRQFNSSLDIRALGECAGWRWDATRSDAALALDRSFFYRALHVGRKP